MTIFKPHGTALPVELAGDAVGLGADCADRYVSVPPRRFPRSMKATFRQGGDATRRSRPAGSRQCPSPAT
jgi:hypothetical protein